MKSVETTTAKPTKKKWPRKGATGRVPKAKITKEERRKKYTDIAKKRRDKLNGKGEGGGNKNYVCYNCRQPGHNAADCPSLNGGEANNSSIVCTPVGVKGGGSSTILCYKCGSTEHALHNCPKRHRGDPTKLPFATCFICGEKGHLASACSQNKHGIYVNGGSCRYCESQQHLATNCPNKKKRKTDDVTEKIKEDKEQAFVDEVLQVDENPSSTVSNTKKASQEKTKKPASTEPKKKKRVVNF